MIRFRKSRCCRPLLCALLPWALSGAPSAQLDGARVYWPLPKNTNIFAVRSVRGIANAAWTNWNQVQPGVDIETEAYLLSYTRVQPIFGRTAYWQAVVPAGTVDTSSVVPGGNEFQNGFGDPTFGVTVNLFGKPEMMAKDYARHDQEFSADLGLMLGIPVGTYDENESLNVGSNQWKVRLSMPVVQSLGPWVPGERTTLELVPSVTMFGDNDEALGNEIEQDPLLGLEAHLTRDLTRETFLGLDYTLLSGGEQEFTNAAGAVVRRSGGLDAHLLGATVGYEINDNLRLFFSHSQALSNDSGSFELDGSLTMITLSWSWHDVLEKVRNFRDD